MISHLLNYSKIDTSKSSLINKKGNLIIDLQNDQDLLNSMESPLWSGICKSHHFEIKPEYWIIYIYRDAREVLASFREFHKLKNIDDFLSKEDKKFIKRYIFDILKHWIKAVNFKIKYPNQIVFISYKNLHKNPSKCLSRVASFLRLSISEDILDQAINSCCFEKMALSPTNQSKNGVRFIRKGKPDGGRGEFDKINLFQIFIITLAPYLLLRFLERIQK